jgi:hypothetical protein
MSLYLYHKKHKITGLNYFGKTDNDPINYNGSGVYWNSHLRKHGKLIETVQVWEFDNINERSEFAIKFSAENNIVKSDEWANLCPENGLDGGDKFGYMPKDKLANINARKSKNVKQSWQEESRINANTQSAKKQWATRTDDEIQKLASKISNTLLTKTVEQRAEAKRKRKETLALNRKEITCPHCNLIGTNKANMNRYHFNKCKKYSLADKIITKRE